MASMTDIAKERAMSNPSTNGTKAKREQRRQPSYARRHREKHAAELQRAYLQGFKDGRKAEAQGSYRDE